MIEMQVGDTIIKVMPHKVDEMIRKGWHIVTDEPEAQSEDIQDDSEGGIEDGCA
jgi:hypothetical protein